MKWRHRIFKEERKLKKYQVGHSHLEIKFPDFSLNLSKVSWLSKYNQKLNAAILDHKKMIFHFFILNSFYIKLNFASRGHCSTISCHFWRANRVGTKKKQKKKSIENPELSSTICYFSRTFQDFSKNCIKFLDFLWSNQWWLSHSCNNNYIKWSTVLYSGRIK